MDADTLGRRRRVTILSTVGVAAILLATYIASQSSVAPDIRSESDPTSTSRNGTDATLRAPSGQHPPLESAASAVGSEVATRLHAQFLKEHPETTSRTAVTGNVVDADGHPLSSGRVIYRSPGGPWQIKRIEYDGTFEVLNAGPGPYEMIASGGNGPIDRHAAITSAGDGDRNVLLRAPHAGTLKIRLEFPPDWDPYDAGGYANLTREDAEEGVATSSILRIRDREPVEFTGLDPGVGHVLWVHDRSWSTGAYLLGVKSQPDELVVVPSDTVSIGGTIRSAALTHLDTARLLAAGIDAHLASSEIVMAPDLTMPGVEIDASLPRSNFGVRLLPLRVPKIPFHLTAMGYSFDARDARIEVSAEATLKPGESILADWHESR